MHICSASVETVEMWPACADMHLVLCLLLLLLQIYTQLSKTLGKVFFPSNNPALQALSFWGVFFSE
jgi:hypothetical protein